MMPVITLSDLFEWAVIVALLSFVVGYALAQAGAKIRFKAKCPCCRQELVIDPKRETANLSTFKDREGSS